MTWIQTVSGKWHHWPYGARAAACGTVTAATLKVSPAIRAYHALPPEAEAAACRTCLKADVASSQQVATGSPREAGADPGASSAAAQTSLRWIGYLRAHCTRVHVKVAARDLTALADLLTEVGTPDDAAAQDVYRQVTALLLTPVRIRTRDARGRPRTQLTIPHLKDAVAKLPPRAGALAHVASALRCWRAVMGRQDPGRFNAEQVIEVMLQVPAPEPYVAHLKARGFDFLGAMFHPNTLARARKDGALRGIFQGSPEYWAATLGQLHVVTE